MQNNPNNKKSIIKKIVVSIVILAIVVGAITGGVVYLNKNKDKLEWNLITFPWEKKGFMWPWEQGNYTAEEAVKKEIEEETVIVSGLKKPNFKEPETHETTYGTVTVESVELDKKGFEISLTYKSKNNDYKRAEYIELNKIIVDDLDFQLDKMTINVDSTEIIKLSRPKFELYNKDGFKKIELFYKERNSDGEEVVGNLDLSFYNMIEPTTKIGKKISVDKKTTVNGSINIYYWKRVVDSDNTYLYFYVENGDGQKTLSIKRLLLNDKIYDYPNLKEVFYSKTNRGFAIKIPKKDIKKIKDMEITFFIKTEPKDNYGEGIYMTNEFFATIKD